MTSQFYSDGVQIRMTGKEEFFFQRNDDSVIRVHIVGLYNPKSKRKSHYFYYGEECHLHEIDGWSGFGSESRRLDFETNHQAAQALAQSFDWTLLNKQ